MDAGIQGEAKERSLIERLLERCAAHGGSTCEARAVPVADRCERCLAVLELRGKLDLRVAYPAPDSALQAHGELYRNGEGIECWRIRDRHTGLVLAEGVESDFDAMWVANAMVGGSSFADEREVQG